eukprot:31469-Pelagococcus_subviridis.AAC.1
MALRFASRCVKHGIRSAMSSGSETSALRAARRRVTAWVNRSVSRTSYRSNVEREARVKSDDGKKAFARERELVERDLRLAGRPPRPVLDLDVAVAPQERPARENLRRGDVDGDRRRRRRRDRGRGRIRRIRAAAASCTAAALPQYPTLARAVQLAAVAQVAPSSLARLYLRAGVRAREPRLRELLSRRARRRRVVRLQRPQRLRRLARDGRVLPRPRLRRDGDARVRDVRRGRRTQRPRAVLSRALLRLSLRENARGDVARVFRPRGALGGVPPARLVHRVRRHARDLVLVLVAARRERDERVVTTRRRRRRRRRGRRGLGPSRRDVALRRRARIDGAE